MIRSTYDDKDNLNELKNDMIESMYYIISSIKYMMYIYNAVVHNRYKTITIHITGQNS